MPSNKFSWRNVRSHIYNFGLFLKSTPPIANYIGLFTSIGWLIKLIWFDHIPEAFPRAYDLGKFVEGLFSALIAGYVFYLFFALWPDYQARRRLAPYLSGKIKNVVGDCLAITSEIQRVSGRPLSLKSSTSDEIKSAFTEIPANATPNMGAYKDGQFIFVPWAYYFENQRERTHSSIEDLFKQSRFLDPEAVALLTEIDNCAFLLQTKSLITTIKSGHPIIMPGPTYWKDAFVKYAASCRKLAEWQDLYYASDGPPVLS